MNNQANTHSISKKGLKSFFSFADSFSPNWAYIKSIIMCVYGGGEVYYIHSPL